MYLNKEEEKVKTILVYAGLFLIPMVMAFVSLIIYAATFGFFMHLEYVSEYGVSWLTFVMGFLAICYLITCIVGLKSVEYESIDCGCTGVIAMIMLPVIAMLLCGAGLFGAWLISLLFESLGWSGITESISLWIKGDGKGLSPAFALRSSLIILSTYAVIGLILQTIGTIIILVIRLFRRKGVGNVSETVQNIHKDD